MTPPRKRNELNARDLRVTFSPAVQEAFGDLAAAVRKSEHFDAGIYQIVNDWANGKPTTVHDVMISLPTIAGEMAEHIAKTADQHAQDAWDTVCAQMPEHGFIISTGHQRLR